MIPAKLSLHGLVVGLFAGFCAAVASSGCGLPLPSNLTPGGSSQAFNFTSYDGTLRTYLVYIPYTYNITNPAPLILSFHGNLGTSANQEGDTQFSTKAMNQYAIAVYPQGYQNHWQGAPYAVAGVDDIGFIKSLVANLTASYCIDTDRIYASGQSNGGGFVGTLACSNVTSSIFAAFAANSGAFYPTVNWMPGYCNATTAMQQTLPPCNPGRKFIPFLEIHGEADGQIPYLGGDHNYQCLPAITRYIGLWSRRDGFGNNNRTTVLGDGSVVMYEWGKGYGNGLSAPVQQYKIAGLGHAWPSNFGTMKFSSSPVVMAFFGNWTLRGSVPAAQAAYVGPQAPATVGAFSYIGCYNESSNGRTFASTSTSSAAMTIELCASFCANYNYFGVEYSTQCYCGSTMAAGAGLSTGCTMTCGGNLNEWCGGGNRLTSYQKTSTIPQRLRRELPGSDAAQLDEVS